MRIIGPPSGETNLVRNNLMTMGNHSRFVADMFGPLWRAAVEYNIDPVGVVAQAVKETGGGHFRGQVKPEFYNTCGLKVRHVGKYPGIDDGDMPLAHAQFASWYVGATAHVQHLCAYAGIRLEHLPDILLVDPRYTLVSTDSRLENWSELGGRWAPSPTYGQEIEQMMTRLKTKVNV